MIKTEAVMPAEKRHCGCFGDDGVTEAKDTGDSGLGGSDVGNEGWYRYKVANFIVATVQSCYGSKLLIS